MFSKNEVYALSSELSMVVDLTIPLFSQILLRLILLIGVAMWFYFFFFLFSFIYIGFYYFFLWLLAPFVF